jgi:hypothetical protein
MAMSVEQTQQAIQAYGEALLNHGDFAHYFSDDVLCTVEGIEGTAQRYQGRDAVQRWINAAHALGEIRLTSSFAGEGHAAIDAEFVRKDGVVVPYAVIYDLTDGKITALRLYFTGPVQA